MKKVKQLVFQMVDVEWRTESGGRQLLNKREGSVRIGRAGFDVDKGAEKPE